MKLNSWVKVKKNSPSWFIDPYLSEAVRTMVVGVNPTYRQVRVAHLLNMWLPMADFEIVDGSAKTYAEEMK